MSSAAPLSTLSLSYIAHRCAQETERFFGRSDYDPQPCFELFRRALVARDQAAYSLLYRQYQPLVTSWIERHPSYARLDEETQYFVNRAFEKLWRALTPAKFGQFADLKALLAYLKLCAHSAIVDYLRHGRPDVVDEEPTDLQLSRDTADLEEQSVAQAQRQTFWRLIDERVGDERERMVLYGSFVLGLKPKDLHARFQGQFASVNEIYRVKQNLLERLRRDAELRQMLLEAA